MEVILSVAVIVIVIFGLLSLLLGFRSVLDEALKRISKK